MPADRADAEAVLLKPLLWATVACLALAVLSAAVLPTVPSYDPWAWIVWGRELVDPHWRFATDGGPSWKPLPVVFTTVYGLFGGAAPTLWVITARAGGLLSLLAAWRLASRLIPARAYGWLAGTVAVLGLVLTQEFFYYMFRGTSEPLLLAAALWSLERLTASRHWQAFLLAVALSLLRPEAWPFVGCYSVWLWFRRPRLRPLLAAGLLSIPVLWLVPPWVGSGQPLLAAAHARAYNGNLGQHPLLTALRRSLDLQIVPVVVLAAAGLLSSWRRRAAAVTGWLGAAAAGWVAIVVAMVAFGYPGLERFFLPASAVACVLAGAGFAALTLEAGERVRSMLGRGAPYRDGRSSRLPLVASLLTAVVLLGLSIPLATSRIDAARASESAARHAAKLLDQLAAAARSAGGRSGVFPCRSSSAAVNHSAQTALAWKLRVTLGRVGTALKQPGVDFVGPHDVALGIAAPVAPGLSRREPLARAGAWRVLRVTAPGRSDPCVGR